MLWADITVRLLKANQHYSRYHPHMGANCSLRHPTYLITVIRLYVAVWQVRDWPM